MSLEKELKGRFRNDFHKGIINLTYTLNQIKYPFIQLLKKHKITEPQYNILKVLRGFQSETPVSINFLRDRMLDRNSDVSRIVDRLFSKGLVDRKEHLSDRRQKDIDITQKGLDLLYKMDECEKEVDTLLNNLSPTEVKELNRLLDKIRTK